MEKTETNILCVGLVCIDIINEVESFPKEDTDQRIISLRKQRGGNASNNCTVLGILGSTPYFLGTIAVDQDHRFILDDFGSCNTIVDLILEKQGHRNPCSTVIISSDSGSRTILHSGNTLPEVTFDEFSLLNLSKFKWIHFEGRNKTEVRKMMQFMRKYHSNITLSLELEKITKPELEELLPLSNVVFLSKEYAVFKGYTSMVEAVEGMYSLMNSETIIICPWGEKGAAAKASKDSEVVRSPIFSPPKVVDTLAAGDTFIGATIHALTQGRTLQESITFGCRVAGTKVGLRGWGSDVQKQLSEIPL